MATKKLPTIIYVVDDACDDGCWFKSIDEIVDNYDGDVKYTKVNKYKLECAGIIDLQPTFKVKSKTKQKGKIK